MNTLWHQIHPQDDTGGHARGAIRPCGRDFAHGESVYIFGGAWERYGRSEHWRDYGKLGGGNDLWRFDTQTEAWHLLEEDDWSLDYGESAPRPGARMLASFSVVGDHAYMFGGLAVMEEGFAKQALNDLWRYHVPTGRWEQIHPNTGWCDFAQRPSHPPIRAVHGSAVGNDIYVFGGWPGTVPTFCVNDLWRYDTVSGRWDLVSPWRTREGGAGYDTGATQPGARYCLHLFAHGESLYLFSGRDTGVKRPEFFNDLWRYEPGEDRWTLLEGDDGSADFSDRATRPAARYGSGHTVLGDSLYLFGGHNGIGTCVERNDFWRYIVPEGRWELLHQDDGNSEYGPGQGYPPLRRVSVMEGIGRSLYLFGGINCFMGLEEEGYSLPLNDLWRCDLEK